jgi:hypothetical protein
MWIARLSSEDIYPDSNPALAIIATCHISGHAEAHNPKASAAAQTLWPVRGRIGVELGARGQSWASHFPQLRKTLPIVFFWLGCR